MKVKRISYLAVLCPALILGLTSCNKGRQTLSYEEAYAMIAKIAPEYNYRSNLVKSDDITFNINNFTIDGKVMITDYFDEPTNIRFALPKQENYKVNLKNETGVMGALEVRKTLSRDIPSSNVKAAKFGGNFLYNCLFNPFFTTFTMSYLHEMIFTVNDQKIVNEEFSTSGDIIYVSYSIPDLKTFTQLADEYELREMSRLFTVFRGTDGNVLVTFGFDKFGYVNSISMKIKSEDIALIGDIASNIENFRGYADVDMTMYIKQNYYAESEYYNYTVTDQEGNALTVRAATKDEYVACGSRGRDDQQFGDIEDVVTNYYDIILPTYGTDFVIDCGEKEVADVVVYIDGIATTDWEKYGILIITPEEEKNDPVCSRYIQILPDYLVTCHSDVDFVAVLAE